MVNAEYSGDIFACQCSIFLMIILSIKWSLISMKSLNKCFLFRRFEFKKKNYNLNLAPTAEVKH